MGAEIVKIGRSELAINDSQTFWSQKQQAALTQLGIANANNADLAVFFHYCVRTGLDPFARQIYMISRQGKQSIQTGIDGFRLIARRACDARNETLGYEETLWCGEDGKWTDVWISSQPPVAAKVTVLRSGGRYPAVALFNEYASYKDSRPVALWGSKPSLMLAKCAEALALRKAFPQDLAGLYTSDEMGSAQPETPQVIDAPVITSIPATEPVTSDQAVATVVETLGGREISKSNSFLTNALLEEIQAAKTIRELDEVTKKIKDQVQKGILGNHDRTVLHGAWDQQRKSIDPTLHAENRPSIDDLELQIETVNSAHSFDVVKAVIEAAPYNAPIKRRLFSLLDKRKEEFDGQLLMDEESAEESI